MTGDPVFQRRLVLVRDFTAYWMPRLKQGMTIEERGSAFSRREAPERCTNLSPLKSEGVGNLEMRLDWASQIESVQQLAALARM